MLDCIDEEEKQQLKRLRESARGSSAESSDTKADGTEPPTPQSESGELQSSGGKNAAYFFDIGEGSQVGATVNNGNQGLDYVQHFSFFLFVCIYDGRRARSK